MTLPDGIDYDATQRALHGWVVAGSGLPDSKCIWSGQDGPRPKNPAITMRLSNDAEMSKMWVDTVNNPLVFDALVVDSIDVLTGALVISNHGRLTGDGPVRVASTGTMPGGVLADTDYWLIVVDSSSIKLAASYKNTGGGQGSSNPIVPVEITDIGSDVITVSATSRTVQAGAEILAIARGLERVTLELHCHSADSVGASAASSILQRLRSRRMLPSQRERLRAAGIGLLFVERVRAVQGIRDAVLFEPRAYLDIQFCVPCEVAEAITIIQTVEITNQMTGDVQVVEVVD